MLDSTDFKSAHTFPRFVTDGLMLLGAQMRALRAARGISSRNLAERCGIAKTTIGSMERGAGGSLLSLAKLLDALNRAEWLNELALEGGAKTEEPASTEFRLRRLGAQLRLVRESRNLTVKTLLSTTATGLHVSAKTLETLERTGQGTTRALIACAVALGRRDWILQLCPLGNSPLRSGPQRVAKRRGIVEPKDELAPSRPIRADAKLEAMKREFRERVNKLRFAKNLRKIDFYPHIRSGGASVQVFVKNGHARLRTVVAIAHVLGCDDWLGQIGGTERTTAIRPDLTPTARSAAVGAQLKQLRISKNLSQEELAALVGVSRNGIADAENGTIMFDQFVLLLHVLGRSDWLSELPEPQWEAATGQRVCGARVRSHLEDVEAIGAAPAPDIDPNTPSAEELLDLLARGLEATRAWLSPAILKTIPPNTSTAKVGLGIGLGAALRVLCAHRDQEAIAPLAPHRPSISGAQRAAVLGREIRHARERVGLSGPALARRAGIGRDTLATLELRGTVKFKTTVAVLRALGQAQWVAALLPPGYEGTVVPVPTLHAV